jgi:23S rRNA (guanosine2251-2'-O)-methyltransferase
VDALTHPRDRWITVYGRKPVLEALRDRELTVNKLLVARSAKGDVIHDILRTAKKRRIAVQRVDARQVTRLSKNARQDQGVAADVEAPAMTALIDWLPTAPPTAHLMALDGVTTPGNVGLCIRSASAAGLEGLVLPRSGTASLGPLVLKASAGTAFRAPILRCATVAEALSALQDAGFVVVALAGEADAELFDVELPPRAVFVMGSESAGVSPETRKRADLTLRIPMASGIESLNVACAATLVAFEVVRARARA